MPNQIPDPSLKKAATATPSSKAKSNAAALPKPKGFISRIGEKITGALKPKPIQGKVVSVAMIACIAAMLVAGLVFFVFQIYSGLLDSRNRMKSLARITTENVRELVAIKAMPELIAALDGVMDYPHVTDTAIYNAEGRLAARPAKKTDSSLAATVAANVPAGSHLGFTGLLHHQPIIQDGQRLGTLTLKVSMSELLSELRFVALVGIGAAILAIAFARHLLGKFTGVVAKPVTDLAQFAATVTKDANYSLRAEKQNGDEVGFLAESFNGMLKEIEDRDAALNQATAHFEEHVRSRTSQLETEVLERRQAEDALKNSEHRYRNLFENNPMPMWVMDLETLQFIAVNNSAVRHYGYSHAEFREMSLHAITDGAAPIDVERAFRTSQKSFDAGEWRHKRHGGDVIEVHLTAHAIVFAGKVAKIVLANDVTERNRTQREITEMHKKLVDASRAAGMAEVATGVLHNVGNVLNSVNVSANVLAESVRKSKAASIRKVADLLEANKGDLTSFFGTGGKGQMVPGYLATLAQQFEAEQEARLSEIDHLTKNIAHIKDIVAMQQDHAKVAGVMEDFTPRVLVDEALRMTAADLRMTSINVEVACPENLPLVTTDRHKVLQILVNLITNAQQAMEQTPLGKRTLGISVKPDSAGFATIAIRDSGCGIPEENITRVFNHGFTTKPTGHGFGLHSAANAATEIGGGLTGTSDGVGKGATFVLSLPFAKAATIQKAA